MSFIFKNSRRKHSARGFLQDDPLTLILEFLSALWYSQKVLLWCCLFRQLGSGWLMCPVSGSPGRAQGKSIDRGSYVHLLLNVFLINFQLTNFQVGNKDSWSLLEHSVGYYLYKPLWTNETTLICFLVFHLFESGGVSLFPKWCRDKSLCVMRIFLRTRK